MASPPDYSLSAVHVVESIAKGAAGTVVLTAATGTPGNTVSDVGGSFSQATLNNNFKAIADKVNAIIALLQVD